MKHHTRVAGTRPREGEGKERERRGEREEEETGPFCIQYLAHLRDTGSTIVYSTT